MDQASGETCSLKSRRSAYVSSRHSGEWSVSRDGKSGRNMHEQGTAERGRHEGKREWVNRRSHGERGESAARRPQGRLCASKPRWIYRTTHSVVRCSRHGAIRHVPKRCRSPAVARSQTVTPLGGILHFKPALARAYFKCKRHPATFISSKFVLFVVMEDRTVLQRRNPCIQQLIN